MDNNYICAADIHARSTKPLFRKEDNFLDVVSFKISQIVEITNENKADLLIAGDLFESTNISYEVFNIVFDHLKSINNSVYIVSGQHDLKNHLSNIRLSPIYSLQTDKIHVLTNHQYKHVYGCQWGIKPDETCSTLWEIEKTILLTHTGVTKDKPPKFLTDSVSAKSILKKYKNFNWIVTGDYHEPHITQYNNRWLINPGSMLRTKVDQLDHKPRVYLLNTKNNTVKPIFLKITPAKKAFNITESQISKNQEAFKKEIQDLVQTLKFKSKKASFTKALKVIIKKSGTSIETKSYIQEVLNGCRGI